MDLSIYYKPLLSVWMEILRIMFSFLLIYIYQVEDDYSIIKYIDKYNRYIKSLILSPRREVL